MTGPYINQADAAAISQGVLESNIPILRNLLFSLGTNLKASKVPGNALTQPATNVVYYAPPGSYTTPADGTLVLTGAYNLIFWDGAHFTFMEVSIDMSNYTSIDDFLFTLNSNDLDSTISLIQKVGTQVISNNVDTQVALTIGAKNTSNIVINNGAVVIRQSGVYKLDFISTFNRNAASTGLALLKILVNGSDIFYEIIKLSASSSVLTAKINMPGYLFKKGDVVTARVFQNTGADMALASIIGSAVKTSKAGARGYYFGSFGATVGQTTYLTVTDINYDTLGAMAPNSNATIKSDGTYLISSFIRWNYNPNTGTFLVLVLNVNGIDVAFDKQQITQSTDWATQLSYVANLKKGDIVKFGYFVNFGCNFVQLDFSFLKLKNGTSILNQTTQQVLSANIDSKISFQDISAGDNTYANGNLTIRTTGYYQIGCYVDFANDTAVSDKAVKIFVNGVANQSYIRTSALSDKMSFVTEVLLAAGDVVSLYLNASVSNSSARSQLSVSKIADEELQSMDITKRFSALEGAISADGSAPVITMSTQAPALLLNAAFRTKLNAPVFDINPVPGQFDSGMVECFRPYWDTNLKKFAATYTGYINPPNSPTNQATIGWATSNDLINWTRQGIFLDATGGTTRPDRGGATGCSVQMDPETFGYHAFYIGLTLPGYEGGDKSICHAYRLSMNDPWIRDTIGIIYPYNTFQSLWRQKAVWNSNLVRRNGLWYLFFNATGNDDLERTGYATSNSLYGPWNVDDINSPVLPIPSDLITGILVNGDPFVYQYENLWIMSYATQQNNQTRDDWAYTTDDLFPLGWKIGGTTVLPDKPYDNLYAHKPWVVRVGSKLYHFYTAVDTSDHRCAGLSISN